MDYTKSESMNGKYRATKEKNRSGFYIVLSVIFLIVLLKWGIPVFIGVLSSPSSTPNNTTMNDNVPPQIPVISALPEATNSSKIKVEGFTEMDADVELFVNDEVADSGKADSNGAFTLRGNLVKGSNRIQLKAKDASTNISQSEIVTVTYDDKPIELIISSPKDGSEYYGSVNQTVDIKGAVNKNDATVIVNGSYASVDKEGSFNQRIMLNNGDNNIVVKVSDRSGNQVEKSFKLIYNP